MLKELRDWWQRKHEPAVYRGIGMPLIKGTINITSPEQAKRVIKMVRGEIPIPRAETE